MSFITQILLPKRDHLGRTISRGRHAPFLNRMIVKFGGWTRQGWAEGSWLSLSGELVAEEHWVYEIGHPRQEVRFWQEEKERLKEEFEQEEIWIVQWEGRRV